MARPKPPEDLETISVRLPASVAERVRELAAESRTATGQKMSVNQYCAGVLTQAAARGLKILERIQYDMIEETGPVALVSERDPESGKTLAGIVSLGESSPGGAKSKNA